MKLSEVVWRYPIGPENIKRIVAMQRLDGPYKNDKIGSDEGHYYLSVERYCGEGIWEHINGSTTILTSFEEVKANLENKASFYK